MLIPIATSLAQDLRTLQAKGFEGYLSVFSQVENWWTYALNLWLFGKLTWNPDLDPQALMRAWVQAAYPVTAEVALPLYQQLERIGQHEEQYQRVDTAHRLVTKESRAQRKPEGLADLSNILRALDECQHQLSTGQEVTKTEGRESDYLMRLDMVLRYSSLRYSYLQALVSALDKLGAAESAGTQGEAGQESLRSARRLLEEMDASAQAAVAMAEEPGDRVEGTLLPVYVRRWAKLEPERGFAYTIRKALEDQLVKLEKGGLAD